MRELLRMLLASVVLLAAPAVAQVDSASPRPGTPAQSAPPPAAATQPPAAAAPLRATRPPAGNDGRIRPPTRAQQAGEPAADGQPQGGPARTIRASPECRDLPANDAASATLVAQLCERAQRGERDSAFRLGQLYTSGAGVPRDRSLGLSYLRLAAQQGHAVARALLPAASGALPADSSNVLPSTPPEPLTRAECLRWSIPNPTSRRFVLETCDRAVNGDIRAYAALGHLFASHKVVTRDEALAVRLLRVAMQGGNGEAAARLIMMGYQPYEGAVRVR